MNKITKLILLWVIALMALPVSAQQRRISGTVSDDIDVIIGANVVEYDKNNRIVSQAVNWFLCIRRRGGKHGEHHYKHKVF